MIKKLFCLILCSILAVTGCFGFTACTQYSSDKTQQETIDEIVSLAIDEADSKIDDYIDVKYFVNLAKPNQSPMPTDKIASNSIQNNSLTDIEYEQYKQLTISLADIISDIPSEEYQLLQSYAEEDSDIAIFIEMAENDFVGYNLEDKTINNPTTATTGALVGAAAAGTISSILTSAGVSNIGVVAIKAAYNTMVTTLKLFFVPTAAKAVIITAAILILTTVIIINWDKIVSIFNQIVDIFVSNAKKLASTVSTVFNKIFNTTIQANQGTSKIYKDIDDVVNGNSQIKNKLKQLGKSISTISRVLKTFLNITSLSKLYESDDKVLCIGRDIKSTYKASNDPNLKGYQNYADKYNYWRFWVSNYTEQVDIFGTELIMLSNEILIHYCCSNDWDFILVTNPYYYMHEREKIRNKSFGGNAYANEIKIIRNEYNYKTFLNGPSSWEAIKCPGYNLDAYYAPAYYRVSL